MNQNLAIVISAYKGKFLKETLESIANQTDQRFKVYIYDDASPEFLQEITAKFIIKSDRFVYHRFDTNLGGKSLTKQYDRCIRLCKEPWIWLFSDDDLMEPNCIAAFYSALEATRGQYDIYRFNTATIDRKERIIALNPPHPQWEPWYEFIYFYLKGMRGANQQELIFRRSKYLDIGGFVEFPLAWWSDLAFAIDCGTNRGFWTMQNIRILFRSSGENLSSLKSKIIYHQKMEALIEFTTWLIRHIQRNGCGQFPEREVLLKFSEYHFFKRLRDRHSWLSKDDFNKVINMAENIFACQKRNTYIRLIYCNILFIIKETLHFIQKNIKLKYKI